MDPSKQLTERVQNLVARVVPPGLDVSARIQPGSAGQTFEVEIMTSAGEQRFAATWANRGWPADVERAVALSPHTNVVLAVRISDGAKQWLSERHIGWVDEAGSANVVLPTGLVIVRESITNRIEKAPTNGWTKSMLVAVEAMCDGASPTVEAIEMRAGMSRGAAANALARLEQIGLLMRSEVKRGPKSARRIIDVDQLVDQYAAAATVVRAKQPVILLHVLWSDALAALQSDIAVSLNLQPEKWAVTGAAASTLLAPYLADVSVVELYVDKNMFNNPDRLAMALGGRRVQKGHRIEVRELPSTLSADGPVIKGVRVALPVRVYADLLAEGGRSAEAAQHLSEVISLGPDS